MSNPTKIYNDYVRANLPSTMTFDSSTNRYDINNHSFFKFKKSNWYFKYITKFGYASLSVYAVNDFDPSLVFDFEQNYYRTGGTDSTLSSSVTHSASSNATMTDSDGNIKWRPHNLFSYSEDFSNSYWTQTGVTITTNAETAPDGNTTADKITPTAVSEGHKVNKTLTLIGDSVTFSVYVKPSGYNYVALTSSHGAGGGGRHIVFNLTGNGSIESQDTYYTDASITPLADGWFLCEATFDPLYTTARGLNITPLDTSVIQTYTGDGTSGIYIWGAHTYRSDLGGMVNNPATGDSYVPTTSSAVYLPRVGHHIYNGDAWVNEGVLHESEARTNSVTYSNDFSDSSWGKNWMSLTASSTTSPDGSSNGWKLRTTGTTNCYLSISGARSSPTTYSLYVKKHISDYVVLGAGGGSKGFLINFSFTSGTIVDTRDYNTTYETSTVENAGNGWYRISVTGSSAATNNFAVFPWASATAPTNLYSNNVGSGQSVYIYGAQTEESKSTPSSYIPTSGSTVTKAAETLTVPAANLPYDSTNMSIQMDGRMTYADTNQSSGNTGTGGEVEFIQWRVDASNYIHTSLVTNLGVGTMRFRQEASGVNDLVESSDGIYSPDILVPFNLSSRHGSTFINGATDGTALTANTTPTALPDLSATDLNLASDFMGTIGKFRVWSEDLTDTGIATASAPSTEPSLQLTFDGSSTSSFTVLDWSE